MKNEQIKQMGYIITLLKVLIYQPSTTMHLPFFYPCGAFLDFQKMNSVISAIFFKSVYFKRKTPKMFISVNNPFSIVYEIMCCHFLIILLGQRKAQHKRI